MSLPKHELVTFTIFQVYLQVFFLYHDKNTNIEQLCAKTKSCSYWWIDPLNILGEMLSTSDPVIKRNVP